jgi:hypothetical protein
MAEQERVVVTQGIQSVIRALRRYCVFFFCGFCGGLAAAILTMYLWSWFNKQGETFSKFPKSYNIDQAIAAVKRDLAAAQLQYQEGQRGPAFFIRDFDLEVNIEFTEETQGETSAQGIPLSAKVVGTRSQGQGQTVRLHFESIGYEVTKLLIEQCARLYLIPSTSSQPDKNLGELLPKMLDSKERPPQAMFTECVEGRLPSDFNRFIQKLMSREGP